MSADSAPVFCQIASSSHVSYRAGVGPWLNQGSGSVSAVLPVQVKTREAQSRLQVGSLAFFEATPKSEFSVNKADNGELALTVKSGSVLYALADGVALQVGVPSQKATAVSGQISQDASSVFESVVNMGVVKIASAEAQSVDFYNLLGELKVQRDGAEQAVAAGGATKYSATPAETVAGASVETFGVTAPSWTSSNAIDSWRITGGDFVATRIPSEPVSVESPSPLGAYLRPPALSRWTPPSRDR